MAKIRYSADDKDILFSRMSGLIARVCGELELTGQTEEERIESLRRWLDECGKNRKAKESVRNTGQDVPERSIFEVED